MQIVNLSFLKTYRHEIVTFLFFLLAALIITVLHLFFHPVRVLGMDTSIFYMDEKYTLAAFFSTVTAFLIGYLALTNISDGKSGVKKIVDIAFGFFFVILAFDEYFEVHEYTNTIIKANLKEAGIIQTLSNLSWIFPLSLIIIMVFSLLVVKLKIASKRVRKPMFTGILCFFAVLIFELFGSASYGRDIYVYYVAVEEGLEMIGASLFLLAVLIEKNKRLQ